jgi:hypothetical protein
MGLQVAGDSACHVIHFEGELVLGFDIGLREDVATIHHAVGVKLQYR